MNQLLNAGLNVSFAVEGDFIANGLTIETGGRSKNTNQVKHLDDYLVAADDIEIG